MLISSIFRISQVSLSKVLIEIRGMCMLISTFVLSFGEKDIYKCRHTSLGASLEASIHCSYDSRQHCHLWHPPHLVTSILLVLVIAHQLSSPPAAGSVTAASSRRRHNPPKPLGFPPLYPPLLRLPVVIGSQQHTPNGPNSGCHHLNEEDE